MCVGVCLRCMRQRFHVEEERKKVKGHQVRVHSLIKYGLLSNCPQLRSDEHTSAFSVTVFGYKGGCG